jgi:hypothetical protein
MQQNQQAVETETLPSQVTISEPKFGFAYLLICLIASLLVPGYFEHIQQDGVVMLVILSVIMLSALYLVSNRQTNLFVGILLALPALVAMWWESPLSMAMVVYVGNGLYSIFLCYIVVQIARFLLQAKKIDLDMILAAICLYLIIGLIWAFIYQVIEVSHPGAFMFSEVVATPLEAMDFMRRQFVYFSYVTLSTLGYGDVTPVASVARSWAVLESLTGQVYLTVVIARLVGLSIRKK